MAITEQQVDNLINARKLAADKDIYLTFLFFLLSDPNTKIERLPPHKNTSRIWGRFPGECELEELTRAEMLAEQATLEVDPMCIEIRYHEILNTGQAAEVFQCSRKTVQRQRKRGYITPFRMHRDEFYLREDLEKSLLIGV